MDPTSLLLGAALGGAMTTLLARTREDRPTAQGLSDVVQWGFLVGGPAKAVVMCKDGALMAGWRYRGPDLESASGPELAALTRQLNEALLAFGDGWMWHVDAVRRPAEAYPADPFPALGPDAPDVSVPGWIDAERRAAFTPAPAYGAPGERRARRDFDRRTPAAGSPAHAARGVHASGTEKFVSEFTATLTYLPPADANERLTRAFVRDDTRGRAGGLSAPAVVNAVLVEYERRLKTLEDRLGGRFHLARLDAAAFLSHLHACLNVRTHPIVPPPAGAYLMRLLASQDFTPGYVPLVGTPGHGGKHVHVIGVDDYPAATPGADAVRLDFLNALPVPYRWSSRLIVLSQRTADKIIQTKQQGWWAKRQKLSKLANQEPQSDFKEREQEEHFGDLDATAMLRDANAARAENASGLVRYAFSTQVVVVAHEDPVVAESYATAVEKALNENGYPARRETMNAVDAFLGSLPGHGYYNLREVPLNSSNLAGLWPLTSVWAGEPHNPSDKFRPKWSPAPKSPLFYAATDGSTTFRGNLHYQDRGNTLLVGAPGSGKSMFVGLTVAQWYRYALSLGARTVIFDYDYSHLMLAEARGALIFDPCAGGDLGAVSFQPLSHVHDAGERAWCASWLESLLETQGVDVRPHHRAAVARALELLADAPSQGRTLTEFRDQVQDLELQAALAPYCRGGSYGTLFDGDEDAVERALTGAAAAGSASAADHQLFEMSHLLKLGDKVVGPAFDYLSHRVERDLDGRPTLIWGEEMHAMLRAGAPKIFEKWVLTLRKRNAALCMVFHDVAQLETLPVKALVVGACPTRVFLPNPEAITEENARLYRDLGLNDRQIQAVAAAVPKRDYYISSPLGGRKVQLDLGPVARAFLGTPTGMSPATLRAEVAALRAAHGAAWPRAWLARLGLDVPAGVVIGSTPARGAGTAGAPSGLGGPAPTAWRAPDGAADAPGHFDAADGVTRAAEEVAHV